MCARTNHWRQLALRHCRAASLRASRRCFAKIVHLAKRPRASNRVTEGGGGNSNTLQNVRRRLGNGS